MNDFATLSFKVVTGKGGSDLVNNTEGKHPDGIYEEIYQPILEVFLPWVVFLVMEAFCDLLQPTIMSKIVDIGVARLFVMAEITLW